MVYELDTCPWDLDYNFTLKDFLFGGFQLATNVDSGKYVYSVYCIGFDSRSELSLPDGSVQRG